MDDYFVCPNCGAELKPKAPACTECGSDENTGWSDDTLYDGLDLPDFDDPQEPHSKSIFQNKTFLCAVAIICLISFIMLFVW